MEHHFRVDVRRTDHAIVVGVTGELDLVSSTALEEALVQLDGSGPGFVILDLSDVEFMDSAGLAVLVRAHQRAKGAGQGFGVVNAAPQVLRLLSVTGMDERVTVAQTPEELLGGA
ncbi:MAG: STAS domain-containing protein [Actinomycetota bacterium]|nr:STAS domain-containing protein [Actinomycetota bacterium]